MLLLLELDADGDWFFTVCKRIAAGLTIMESQVGICSSGVVLFETLFAAVTCVRPGLFLAPCSRYKRSTLTFWMN
jgi:hypothetical protein